MHAYGFDLADPVFDVGPWKVSFQLLTLENIYGLDPAHTTFRAEGDGWRLDCTRLSWAGQQERAPGELHATFTPESPTRLRVKVQAAAPYKIKVVKFLLRGLPTLQVLDMLDSPADVPTGGTILRYPNPLRLPVLFARRPDGRLIGIRNEDPHVRAKRFAMFQEQGGPFKASYTLECIHEQDARWFDTRIDVPDWSVEAEAEIGAFRQAQLDFNEAHLGWSPWEQRADVPAWARQIRLCLTLHGMHWSGYVFNTYADMLDIIRFAVERIDGRHLLAYLPGWEGRYYWQYGDFRPEPRLGGEAGFEQLCREARALGVHVMPMFGATCANAWFPNFHEFGPSSHMKPATRNVFHGNQPDWDTGRAHDTGWQAWLNPGAPAWQAELARQILVLADRYGFDAAFLDCAEVWVNDPDFNVCDGLAQLNSRLRAGHPDMLVTAEDWWDGTLGIFPIFQQTSTWRQVPDWAGRYARFIGHICDGDPATHSTGVHEAGYSPYVRLPDTPAYIPTLTFVNGTLQAARAEIEAIIASARNRGKRQEA